MIALVLLVLALCAVLPNRIVVAALPVFWILERLLPANLALIAQIGPVKLAPTDLVIAVLFAKFIVSVVLRKELVIDRWLYVALGAYVAVNLLASIFAGLKFGETQLLRCAVSWSRFVAEMLLVVVAAQAVRTLAQAKVCLRIVLGTLVILAAIQFVNFAGAGHGFVIGEVQGLERGEIRFFGPVGDSIGVVLLLGYLVSLCFVNLAGAAFFLGGIFLTAGFGAVISAAVATGLFLLFGLRGAAFGQFLRRGLWLLPVVLVAGVALAFFAKPGTQTLLGRLTSGRYTESGSQRAASTKLASAMILDNPALGVGYMGYEQALERYGGDAYFDLSKPDGGTANANNQILQALTDGGIFGLLAFAAVIISASRLFLRVAWRSEDRFFYAYFLAAFLWLLTQVFGNLAACWLNPSSFVARLLWISLGVAVAVARLLPAAEPRLVRPAAERREPQLLPA